MIERGEDKERQILLEQFNSLVEQTRGETLDYAMRITGDPQLAEDLYMDTWLEVLERFPNIRRKEPIPFRVYFQRTIKSRYFASQRQQSKSRSFEEYEEDTFAGESDLDNTDTDMNLLLSSLESVQRQALVLQSEGYEPEEAASILGVSVEDFENSLEEARTILLQTLSEDLSKVKDEGNTENLEELDRQTLYQKRALAKLYAFGQREEELLPPNLQEECTLEELAISLQRSRLWVVNHLREFAIGPNFRREKMGRRSAYFPKFAEELLREESEKYPIAYEGRLTIPAIASLVDRDREWVIKTLDDLGMVGEYYYFTHSGRVDLSYESQVVELLREKDEKYVPAEGGWYTANNLRIKLGKSHNWLSHRLKGFENLAELRCDAQGVLREHYPPSVYEALLQMREDQKNKKMQKKWYER